MLSNPMNNWYTDLADVYRMVSTVVNGINKPVRTLIRSKMPCRIYKSGNPKEKMTTTYASVALNDLMACHTKEDIRAGDEIHIKRGGRITTTGSTSIYYAGDPTNYFEPFGGARPRIDHKQVPIGGERKVTEIPAEDDV